MVNFNPVTQCFFAQCSFVNARAETRLRLQPLTITITRGRKALAKTDNTLSCHIGLDSRHATFLVFFFVCAVAASASSASSCGVKQSLWLCILNMQQPHAARTIKHLEIAATTTTATAATTNAPIAGRAKEFTSWQRQVEREG